MRVTSGGVDRLEALEADVDHRRQFGLQAGRRHATDGEAGGGPHLRGVAAFHFVAGLGVRVVEGQRPGQGVRLACVVAGDQRHHRLLADHEHQRLDDGTEFRADGLGRVLGGLRRFLEFDRVVLKARREEGGAHLLHRFVFKNAHHGTSIPFATAGRAPISSNQRLTLGMSPRSISCHSQRAHHG